MLETSARLLRLLSLLQVAGDHTGADLAARLGVDVRTVRRDIEKLRALGYPVTASSGVPGYRLGPGTRLPPLLLDDDEAVAVAVALRTASSGAVTGIEDTAMRALAKLLQVLPTRLRHRVRTLEAVTTSLPSGATGVDPDVLTTVAAACHANEQLRFDYTDHTGTGSLRRVEPHRLVHSGRHWYLLAWDVDKSGWRRFRVDRLRPRIPAGPRFSPRPLPESEAAAATALGITTRAYRYHGRFVLHVPAEVAADRIAPTIGTLEARDDRSCVLHVGSNSLDELALWVAVLGFPFEVEEPPELFGTVRTLVDRLARSIGQDPANPSV
ncbi:helix-turn-helix transcriptional regulator [Saccharomonospora cyanea]|uniref:Putative transcriptional regulator n=1 Tax=Saccharomonospora cyanea NA-134 TaxID=882082 RepID=H5XGS8_9PSEU|nr:YafY family protein [Saccharomonospora cyanea]EHR61621.1 putative transcriptional regulator [Saccharomonospora cyanea NA-134]